MSLCILPAELVEAEALHAPLNDNAPATPIAATAFLGLFVLEIRLARDIDCSNWSLLDLAEINFASLWFQGAT